ncbi:hypothetical protein [Leeuwenhoekiella parthenopeia]|uniref:Uncharacterized protein n=1 Tax=Leeuwenhoekiella parthenopeia TaxID=2890320 RepID=A0ABS8GX54_9FLAO|nr:hypothetical protein [Leeuwenhoekiella parthenopeia]MCC4214595.1 hypothetical protein [Leeuwenhoekiella parthenopeia]
MMISYLRIGFQVFLLNTCFLLNAQVGINTQNPQATLDVNGTARVTVLPVESTSNITVTGLTGGEQLNLTELGANIIFVNNEAVIRPVSRTTGQIDLGIITPDATNGNTRSIHVLDPQLGEGEANDLATFVTCVNYAGANYEIGGIKGGTEGRRLTLFFSDSSKNVSLMLESTTVPDASQRITFPVSKPFFGISGTGSIELVYDADAGADGAGRWLVLKVQG